MKRLLLLVCLLSLSFVLQGCSDIFGCNYSDGPPNAPWTIVYSDQTTVRSGNVKPDGTFNVPKYGGESCSQIRQRVRFGTNLNLSLSASPASVYLPTPPSTGTVNGQSFDTTYGMPRVEYFDSYGYLVGSVYASSVASGGASLEASLPDLSEAYSGNYQIKVTNKTYDGLYLGKVGTANITAWGRDRLDSDGDGWYDDEDCYPDDPYMNCSSGICGGGQEPIYVCP